RCLAGVERRRLAVSPGLAGGRKPRLGLGRPFLALPGAVVPRGQVVCHVSPHRHGARRASTDPASPRPASPDPPPHALLAPAPPPRPSRARPRAGAHTRTKRPAGKRRSAIRRSPPFSAPPRWRHS